jgi:hypothetical protein
MRNKEGRIDTDSDVSCLNSSSDGGLVTENNRGTILAVGGMPVGRAFTVRISSYMNANDC